MRSPIPKKIVLDFETTFAKDPTSPKPYILQSVENGVVGTQNTKTDDIIGGDIDTGGETYNTFVEVSGDIKAPMTYEQIGVMLKVVLGDAKTTPLPPDSGTTPTGFFVHTFKSNECIPSVVLQDTLSLDCDESATQNLIKRFNGLRANTMNIEASPDGDYHASINLVGAIARDSIVDGITELNEDNKNDLGKQNRIKNDHLKLFIDDDVNFYKLAKNFSFNIDRGTTAEQVLSAGAIVEDKFFKLTGNLSSIFNGAFYKKAKTNKEMKTRLVFEHEKYKLEFIMEQTQYSFKDEGRSYGNQYPLNCDFNAFKSTADAKLVVKLTNKIATY